MSSPRCGRRRTGRPRAAGPAASGRCAEVLQGAPDRPGRAGGRAAPCYGRAQALGRSRRASGFERHRNGAEENPQLPSVVAACGTVRVISLLMPILSSVNPFSIQLLQRSVKLILDLFKIFILVYTFTRKHLSENVSDF